MSQKIMQEKQKLIMPNIQNIGRPIILIGNLFLMED